MKEADLRDFECACLWQTDYWDFHHITTDSRLHRERAQMERIYSGQAAA